MNIVGTSLKTWRGQGYLESVLSRFRTFKQDQAGTATVEAVIWIPFFIILFFLIIETTFVFAGHSKMQRLAQDASRKLSIGWFNNNTVAENYILEQMKRIGEATSNQAQAAVDITNGVITTRIGVPASELGLIGNFDFIDNLTITVNAQHLQEL